MRTRAWACGALTRFPVTDDLTSGGTVAMAGLAHTNDTPAVLDPGTRVPVRFGSRIAKAKWLWPAGEFGRVTTPTERHVHDGDSDLASVAALLNHCTHQTD